MDSGHGACLERSVDGGVDGCDADGFLCWLRNDETADTLDEGRALRAISLLSTMAFTSLVDFCSTPCVPRISRRMSMSEKPLNRTSRMAWSV